MTHSLCMHHIIKTLHNDKASQINIFTKKLDNWATQADYEFFYSFLF